MRALILLALLVLAGCAAPAPRVRTVFLDAAPLHATLPNETALPPGFHLGWEQPETRSDGTDAASRVFDYTRGNETVRHQITVGVMRFEDDARLEDTWRSIQQAGPTVHVRLVAPDRLQVDQVSFGGHTLQVFGRQNGTMAWAFESAQGEEVLSDPAALVEGILQRSA